MAEGRVTRSAKNKPDPPPKLVEKQLVSLSKELLTVKIEENVDIEEESVIDTTSVSASSVPIITCTPPQTSPLQLQPQSSPFPPPLQLPPQFSTSPTSQSQQSSTSPKTLQLPAGQQTVFNFPVVTNKRKMATSNVMTVKKITPFNPHDSQDVARYFRQVEAHVRSKADDKDETDVIEQRCLLQWKDHTNPSCAISDVYVLMMEDEKDWTKLQKLVIGMAGDHDPIFPQMIYSKFLRLDLPKVEEPVLVYKNLYYPLKTAMDALFDSSFSDDKVTITKSALTAFLLQSHFGQYMSDGVFKEACKSYKKDTPPNRTVFLLKEAFREKNENSLKHKVSLDTEGKARFKQAASISNKAPKPNPAPAAPKAALPTPPTPGQQVAHVSKGETPATPQYGLDYIKPKTACKRCLKTGHTPAHCTFPPFCGYHGTPGHTLAECRWAVPKPQSQGVAGEAPPSRGRGRGYRGRGRGQENPQSGAPSAPLGGYSGPPPNPNNPFFSSSGFPTAGHRNT